jgi:hypothetical protein
MDCVRAVDGGVEIAVWVVPSASRTDIAGLRGSALKVRVTAPPHGGEANRAVERLIGGVVGGRAQLVRGGGGRAKTVLVSGVAQGEARRRIAEALPGVRRDGIETGGRPEGERRRGGVD